MNIEFSDRQPATFWNTRIPHPRWSQASEKMLETSDRYATQIYNGYSSYIFSLY